MRVRICYTDGEVVDKDLETLQDSLEYLQKEIVEKREFADKITIEID